jgi:Putative peptidoglycan binding domain
MKTIKLLLIALVLGAMAATPAFAGSRGGHHGHHGHHGSHSHFSIGLGLGYPYYGYGYGYGYPYGSYPYGYGYYRPRTVIYSDANYTDDATVAAVQRRLSRAGYYRGAIDGVIGNGTRSAIRAYEQNHGLVVDGRIDRRLLATLGIA